MSLRILCIEDHPDIASYLKLLLEANGYEAIVGASVEQAVHFTNTQEFNLIILDHVLPDGTGIELCRKIRTRDKLTPIIFHTASCDERLKSMALAVGAQGVINKSEETEILLRAVDIHIKLIVGARQVGGPDAFGVR